jgi:hypothetical protein
MRGAKRLTLMLCGASLVFAGFALADDLYIYPQKGQSKEQQEKDKFDCYQWAKGQTGFDPMARPTATSPPPQQEAQQGGVGRGAARGAAAGAVGGAIGGDAGKGAAIGAASGAMIGGMRRRDQRRRQEQERANWEAQQQV